MLPFPPMVLPRHVSCKQAATSHLLGQSFFICTIFCVILPWYFKWVLQWPWHFSGLGWGRELVTSLVAICDPTLMGICKYYVIPFEVINRSWPLQSYICLALVVSAGSAALYSWCRRCELPVNPIIEASPAAPCVHRRRPRCVLLALGVIP